MGRSSGATWLLDVPRGRKTGGPCPAEGWQSVFRIVVASVDGERAQSWTRRDCRRRVVWGEAGFAMGTDQHREGCRSRPRSRARLLRNARRCLQVHCQTRGQVLFAGLSGRSSSLGRIVVAGKQYGAALIVAPEDRDSGGIKRAEVARVSSPLSSAWTAHPALAIGSRPVAKRSRRLNGERPRRQSS